MSASCSTSRSHCVSKAHLASVLAVQARLLARTGQLACCMQLTLWPMLPLRVHATAVVQTGQSIDGHTSCSMLSDGMLADHWWPKLCLTILSNAEVTAPEIAGLQVTNSAPALKAAHKCVCSALRCAYEHPSRLSATARSASATPQWMCQRPPSGTLPMQPPQQPSEQPTKPPAQVVHT
jgi:hypothetical protein